MTCQVELCSGLQKDFLPYNSTVSLSNARATIEISPCFSLLKHYVLRLILLSEWLAVDFHRDNVFQFLPGPQKM
jgi:hypothetical protein